MAKYKCNKCGLLVTRRAIRPPKWIASYCTISDTPSRLYRVREAKGKV